MSPTHDILDEVDITEEAERRIRSLRDEINDDSLCSPGKVTKEMCIKIQKLHERGAQAEHIASKFNLSSANTVYYHSRGDCSHDRRTSVTYSECGWMRVHFKNGNSVSELSDKYGIAEKNVRVHLKGGCSHEDGIKPLSTEEMRKINKERRNNNFTTSICEICGEAFEHKEYRDRVTCSKTCNAKKAAKAAQSAD